MLKDLEIGDKIYGKCNFSGKITITVIETRSNKGGTYYKGEITDTEFPNSYDEDVIIYPRKYTCFDDEDHYFVEHENLFEESYDNGSLHLLTDKFYNTFEEASIRYYEMFIKQFNNDIKKFQERIEESEGNIKDYEDCIKELKEENDE